MDEQIESKTATILRLRINNEFDTYFYNIKVKYFIQKTDSIVIDKYDLPGAQISLDSLNENVWTITIAIDSIPPGIYPYEAGFCLGIHKKNNWMPRDKNKDPSYIASTNFVINDKVELNIGGNHLPNAKPLALVSGTKMLINETMMNIQFNFSMIGKEELKLLDNGDPLQEKLDKVLAQFRDYYDPEDPEYITLAEAFKERFKQHKFKPENIAQFNEENAALTEIYNKICYLRRKDDALLARYNGDKKYVRVHKRIVEENSKRATEHVNPIISTYTDDIVDAMLAVKSTIDGCIYNRNDILKKDAYFADTVFSLVDQSLNKLNVNAGYEDCDFIQKRISKQYLNQYNECYAM